MPSVEVVIDGVVLNKLHLTDKHNAFFKYWLTENDLFATVSHDEWGKHKVFWNDALECSTEIKAVFFGQIRGLVKRYFSGEPSTVEKKDSKGKEKSPIDEIVQIVNRHYATIRYVIVENPEDYRNKKDLKINTSRVLSLAEFYTHMESSNNEFVMKFNSATRFE